MFGITTQASLPPLYLTDYAVWDGYMAGIWHSLLQASALPPSGVVVEVAPGNSVKIAGALAKLGFRGDYWVVEPYSPILETLKERYAELVPDATLHWVTQSLADALPHLPHQPDALLSNHPLDDMILAYAGDAETFGWTQNPGPKVQEGLQQLWQKIRQEPARCSQLQQRVLQDWKQAIDALQPQRLILSQYSSDALKKHDMQDLNEQAKQVLCQLRAHPEMRWQADAITQNCLNQHENYGNAHIGYEVLNAAHWLAGAAY